MKWSEWIEKWGMNSLKVNLRFLEMEFAPKDHDRNAAWDLYVELLTRSATQRLEDEYGDEQAAIDSIYQLFPLTRQTLKANSWHCTEFTKIAIVVLNQIVRPFTSKWHRASKAGDFSRSEQRAAFRSDLRSLQEDLRKYTRMLADMAGVEDMTQLERQESE